MDEESLVVKFLGSRSRVICSTCNPYLKLFFVRVIESKLRVVNYTMNQK
jgi:hypothetical protein